MDLRPLPRPKLLLQLATPYGYDEDMFHDHVHSMARIRNRGVVSFRRTRQRELANINIMIAETGNAAGFLANRSQDRLRRSKSRVLS